MPHIDCPLHYPEPQTIEHPDEAEFIKLVLDHWIKAHMRPNTREYEDYDEQSGSDLVGSSTSTQTS